MGIQPSKPLQGVQHGSDSIWILQFSSASVLPDPTEPSRTAQLLMTFALCNVFLPSRTYITSCYQELEPKATFCPVVFPPPPGQ